MKHYLNFIKTIGLIEISEPFGFDGSTHKVEQGSEYGRDVILGDEEIDLTLTESHFEPLEFPQQFSNGVQFDYASHAFEYLKDVLKNEGWEAEIEYILEKDGVQFSKGIIDGLTAVIEFEQITFKVIQNTKREEVKRRMDVVINAFSDVDLDGNPITPCETVDLLLKAKPIQQISNLNAVNDSFAFCRGIVNFPGFFNKIKNVTTFGIEDTLSWFEDSATVVTPGDTNYNNEPQNFKVLRAGTRLTNIKAKLKLNIKTEWVDGDLPGNAQVIGYLSKGQDNENISEFSQSLFAGTQFYDTGALGPTSNVFEYSINQTVEVDLQPLEQGEVMYFVFIHAGSNSFQLTKTTFIECSIELIATSTSIDSIVKAVRYIDLLKHTCESVGLPVVDCPEYDLGGEHYDNFALNGYLIGQITDKTFNNKLKDVLQVTKELNHGYQINPENIEVLHHDEFFNDLEIGAFIQIPNLINKTEMNTELAVKTFDYNYKNSSKGRETNSEGSIDDIHGQSQRLFPSKKTDKNLKFELDHIRSAFLIEEQRRRVFDNENTTSLQGDDKLYLIKAVPLAPSAVGGFTATLQMQIQTSPFPALKILSNNFRWDLLGIGIFTTFKITAGENVATYSINAIETNVITLTSTAFFSPNPPNFTGTATITIEYNFTNVSLTNQTDEGYTLIEGVQNNDNYSNLDYSIGRNLKRFYSMLGACGRYLTGVIKTTMFEVNGNLVTQKVGETVSTSDSGDIDLEQIKELRLYEPRLETVTVFAEFETATELFEKVATDKGYIRVQKSDNSVISGFPKEMEYKWMDGSLEMKLLPKKESEFYDVVPNLVSSYQINNNLFVSLYDVNDILIVTPLRFDKIRINGVVYTDEIDFANALSNAIE
jgi:hypothetical protein